MPVTTNVQAQPGKPATVVVTVTATGNPATVDVHVVADLGQATPKGNASLPAPNKVSPSAVSWLDQAVAVGTPKVFRAVISPNTTGDMFCTRVTTIVTNNGASNYYDVQRAVACFTA